MSTDDQLRIEHVETVSAIAASPLNVTRPSTKDLLYVRPDNTLHLLIGGTHAIPVSFSLPDADEDPDTSRSDHTNEENKDADLSMDSVVDKHQVVGLTDPAFSNLTVVMEGGDRWRVSLDLAPKEPLTVQCLHALSCVLPEEDYYNLFRSFVNHCQTQCADEEGRQFTAFEQSVLEFAGINCTGSAEPDNSAEMQMDPFTTFLSSRATSRLMKDRAFALLCGDRVLDKSPISSELQKLSNAPASARSCGRLLSSLHAISEDLRLSVQNRHSFGKLCPLLAKLSSKFRPEWVSYYTKFWPDATSTMCVNSGEF
jgi:anaphase-promoting complex subunit 1